MRASRAPAHPRAASSVAMNRDGAMVSVAARADRRSSRSERRRCQPGSNPQWGTSRIKGPWSSTTRGRQRRSAKPRPSARCSRCLDDVHIETEAAVLHDVGERRVESSERAGPRRLFWRAQRSHPGTDHGCPEHAGRPAHPEVPATVHPEAVLVVVAGDRWTTGCTVEHVYLVPPRDQGRSDDVEVDAERVTDLVRHEQDLHNGPRATDCRRRGRNDRAAFARYIAGG